MKGCERYYSPSGHGISYTKTLFVEDKWAESDEKQTFSIPAKIVKDRNTTYVADKCIREVKYDPSPLSFTGHISIVRFNCYQA